MPDAEGDPLVFFFPLLFFLFLTQRPLAQGARLKTLMKAYKAADVDAKWAKTSTARKLARRVARANLNDFDRFKVRVAKKTRAMAIAGAAK